MSAQAAIETFEQWPLSKCAKYDWDAILDGQRHVLRHGEHFECSARSMQCIVHTAAGRRGISVRTVRRDDAIYVEAYGTRKVAGW